MGKAGRLDEGVQLGKPHLIWICLSLGKLVEAKVGNEAGLLHYVL